MNIVCLDEDHVLLNCKIYIMFNNTLLLFIPRLVIETLDGVEKERKCFRMVGGVLVERKVGEVEPALIGNRDKVI